MAEFVNGTCHAKKASEKGPPLFQHGSIVLQAHHIGWIAAGLFTLISVIASWWLINKHLHWYTNKREQRHIVRLLFMVPIYAIISFASYLFWNQATPLILIRDCYESTVLTAFFYLLLTYISPDPEEQKAVFRKNGLSRENDRDTRRKGEKVQRWLFPLGFVKWKPEDGLHFLQLMKWGVLQYCVVRPLSTLAAVILDYVGLYCEASWSPGWGHIYIIVVISLSVSISMYCLLQLYFPVSKSLAEKKPLLKLFAVKAVVFLTFWQATFLSLLSLFGVVKDTQYMTAENINIGIGALLETFEMMVFAFLHIYAFTYRPYKVPPSTSRLRSLGHAMNFAETFRELKAGIVYMFRRFRGRETDVQARREAVLEDVFGHSRSEIRKQNQNGYDEKTQNSVNVSVDVDETVHIGGERQWLGLGDNYGYGLKYQSRKEKSESLGAQIEKELERRGYDSLKRDWSRNHAAASYGPVHDLRSDPSSHHNPGRSRSQRSWWKSAMSRMSHSSNGHDYDRVHTDNSAPPAPHRSDRRPSSYRPKHASPDVRVGNDNYVDPPPPSIIQGYRESRARDDAHRLQSPVVPALIASFTPPPPPSQPPLAHQSHRSYPPQTIILTIPDADDRSSTPPPPPPRESPIDWADRFLKRVFPLLPDTNNPDALVSTESVAVSRHTSAHSHHSGVRLGGAGTVVATGTVVSQVPVVMYQPGVSSQERLVEIPSSPASPTSPSLPSKQLSLSPPIVFPVSGPKFPQQHSAHIHGDVAQHRVNVLDQHPAPPRETSPPHSPPERGAAFYSPPGKSSHPHDPHAPRRERIVLPLSLPSPSTSSDHTIRPPHVVSSPTSMSPVSHPEPHHSWHSDPGHSFATSSPPSSFMRQPSSPSRSHSSRSPREGPHTAARTSSPPSRHASSPHRLTFPVPTPQPPIPMMDVQVTPEDPRPRPGAQLRRSPHTNAKRHTYDSLNGSAMAATQLGQPPDPSSPSRQRSSRRATAPPQDIGLNSIPFQRTPSIGSRTLDSPQQQVRHQPRRHSNTRRVSATRSTLRTVPEDANSVERH